MKSQLQLLFPTLLLLHLLADLSAIADNLIDLVLIRSLSLTIQFHLPTLQSSEFWNL